MVVGPLAGEIFVGVHRCARPYPVLVGTARRGVLELAAGTGPLTQSQDPKERQAGQARSCSHWGFLRAATYQLVVHGRLLAVRLDVERVEALVLLGTKRRGDRRQRNGHHNYPPRHRHIAAADEICCRHSDKAGERGLS